MSYSAKTFFERDAPSFSREQDYEFVLFSAKIQEPIHRFSGKIWNYTIERHKIIGSKGYVYVSATIYPKARDEYIKLNLMMSADLQTIYSTIKIGYQLFNSGVTFYETTGFNKLFEHKFMKDDEYDLFIEPVGAAAENAMCAMKRAAGDDDI